MANQIIIDIGAAANDGTGDPLRTAFNYVNDNFSNVWDTGLPSSNVQFSGNKILTANTNGNLVLAPNGIGKVVANVDIRPNANNTLSLGSADLRWNSVYTQNLNVYGTSTLTNVNVANANIAGGTITIPVGNLHVTGGTNGYVLQTDGAGNLTWTAQTGGSGNGTVGGANTQVQFNNSGNFGGVAGFTFDSTSNTLSVPTATVTTLNATNVVASGIVSATGNVRGGNLNTAGVVSAAGNITGDYFIGNGSLLTGITTSSLGNLSVVGSAIQLATGAPNTSVYLTANGVSGNAYVRIPSNPTTLSDGLSIVNLHGRVEIKAKDGAASQSWYFQEDGSLQLPGAVPAHILSDDDIILQTGSGDHWTFGVNGALTAEGNINPLSNVTYSLGNSTNQWKDIWVSNATIYMNSVPISLTAGNVLTVNGADVVTTNGNGVTALGNIGFVGDAIYDLNGIIVENADLSHGATASFIVPSNGNTTVPVQINNTYGNITLGTGPSSTITSTWKFDTAGTLTLPNNANITVVDNVITEINAVATANSAIGLRAFDNNGNTTASSFFDGTDGTLNFYSYNSTTDTNYNWRFDNGGSFTLPNAPGNVYFGEDANGPVIIPEGSSITLGANRADAAQDYITVSQDGIDLFSTSTISIDNSTTSFLNADINIRSGDDIFLRGRNKPDDSENEGGDINLYAGQGANAVTGGNDTGGGGDIQIYAGAGGIATYSGTGGSSGGYVEILGGDGGTSVDSFVGSGGDITLLAGSAATPTDTANGGWGGSVNISAGTTTRINETGGSISLSTGGASGDGYGPAGSVSINIPESNAGPGGNWYFTGTGRTLEVPANSEIFGPNYGNFTVGCAGNTIVTSSDYGANVKNWVFGYTGNLLAPGNIITPDNFVGPSLRTNLSNFNWSASITNMTQGASTVIVLANNIFGDPWDGQITITDVAGATEANGTWWYQATNSDSIELFTDNTFTTPVDSSAWGTYTGGGVAVTIDYGNIQINAQTVTIQSGQADYNNRTWEFNSKGQTVLPVLSTFRGDVSGGTITGYTLNIGDGVREAVITTPDAGTGEYSSQRLVINPGKGENGTAGEGGDIYLWAGRGGDNNGNGGDVKIRGGYGPGNGQGGYIRMEGGEVQATGTAGFIELLGGTAGGAAGGYISLTGGPGATVGGNVSIQGGYGSGDVGGNVVIQGGGSGQGLASYGNVGIVAGASTWTFDNTGVLTVPGEGIIQSLNDTVILQSVDTGTGNTFSARLGTTGGLYFETTEYPHGWLNLVNNTGNADINAIPGYSGGAGKNININAGAADQTDFYTTPGGNVNITGGLGASNDGGGGGPGGSINITAGNSADSAGVSGNVNITSGNNTWNFDNTGTLTLPQFFVGPGPSEQLTVHGTRQTVGTIGNSSAQLSGHTDFGSAVWIASSSVVQSARITFVVQSNGTAFNWEQFDVAVTKFDSANAIVSVSNRIRSNNAIPYTEVSGYVNSGILEVWFNQPAEQNIGYINYQAVEFNLMAD